MHLAGCVITNSDGEILLLHRSTPKRTQWELPGGKIEDGEDTKETAARELKEELCIDVALDKLIGSKEFLEDKYKMHYDWYTATIVGGEVKIGEPEVHDQYKYWSVEDMNKQLKSMSPNLHNLLDYISTNRIKI